MCGVAILVDELREYPDVRLPFTAWCHMASDRDFAELHAFAARLGLRRAWFQRDHYDLPAHGRAAAVALGAVEVGAGELLERMAGPRGDRARRRRRTPRGVLWLGGSDGPAVLRYPEGALVVIGGPPGAGKSVLARRLAVPVLLPAQAARGLGERRGAVTVCAALEHARAFGAAGAPAHLLLVAAPEEECRARADGPAAGLERRLAEWRAYRGALATSADPAPFASVAVAGPAALERLVRIAFIASDREP
jgi:Protein of unknown function (DUF4031)